MRAADRGVRVNLQIEKSSILSHANNYITAGPQPRHQVDPVSVPAFLQRPVSF